MDFVRANVLKTTIGQTVLIEEYTMEVMITPEDSRDFYHYFTDFRNGDFTDETAKLYSRNQEFSIHALWTNGIDVLHKKLG